MVIWALKSRVADPDDFGLDPDLDPTFKKKPDPTPEKKCGSGFWSM
jgi:hypothetical protein